MAGLENQYDEAMFAFSTGDLDRALADLKRILAQDATHFDAQLALGLAYFRMGDYPAALAEGHKAERLRPDEPLVHTNLSLFYLKAGNKAAAEHHGARARIASWKSNMTPPKPGTERETELHINQSSPVTVSTPLKLPDMPWKKKP